MHDPLLIKAPRFNPQFFSRFSITSPHPLSAGLTDVLHATHLYSSLIIMKYSKAILIAVGGATLAVANGVTATDEPVAQTPHLHFRQGLAMSSGLTARNFNREGDMSLVRS